MAIIALESKTLSWKEAETLFVQRVGYPADDYYKLEEWVRTQGFTVSHVTTYQMMLRVKRQLTKVIAEGGNLRDFSLWAKSEFPTWTRAYTELVFRQNVFSSYAAARFRQINDPDVARVFEILLYDAVNDERTREEHARMGGTQWKRDEFPAGWWPPNGFNCRCEVRAVLQSVADKGGWRRWDRRTDGNPPLADQGFRRNYSDQNSRSLIAKSLLRKSKTALAR
jgi:SPP1 gp7 family putative phage head morphogenesis protein